jgi:predicted RNase H-like nuclease (RuvC/YqgF family)
MDEATLRRIVTEIVREEVSAVREQVSAVREEVRGMEQRLAEGGRLQFRQLSELYRGTLEKVEHLEKHLGERIDATRGAIEALRSSIERQDFRTDELARRVTSLEIAPPPST